MFDTLYGVPILPSQVAIPPKPRLQISPDFPWVSDKFRREWNAWALERFGADERIIFMDPAAAGFRGFSVGIFVANPLAIDRLRIAAEESGVVRMGPQT